LIAASRTLAAANALSDDLDAVDVKQWHRGVAADLGVVVDIP
jgi:hypothetical protein